jgi:serine/threonine protein kinase
MNKPARMLAILVRVLQTAHGGGFIHRDDKPENIFMTNEGLLILVPCEINVGIFTTSALRK